MNDQSARSLPCASCLERRFCGELPGRGTEFRGRFDREYPSYTMNGTLALSMYTAPKTQHRCKKSSGSRPWSTLHKLPKDDQPYPMMSQWVNPVPWDNRSHILE